MPTQAEQIAASQGRQRIPTDWLKELQTWSNSSLLSASKDGIASRDLRLYAGFELDYRLAFNILQEPIDSPEFLAAGEERRREALARFDEAQAKGAS